MPTCIVCRSTQHLLFYEGILRCSECGHVFADVTLDDERLWSIYRRDYFFGEEYSDYVADQRVIQKNFRKRLSVLRRFINPEKHSRLLEIGCAYGFFLDLVRKQFKIAVGLDISEDGVRYAREELGVDAYQVDFLHYDCSPQIFDVICMWDTIEHIRDPHLYIEKISSIVPKDGLLALTTGDIDSLLARLQRDRWCMIHPPTHIHYFSRRTIECLLRQYGFETIYNRYCGFFRSIDNIAYNLFVLRQKRPYLYNIIKRSGLGRIDFYINLYDIMFVIARRC